MPCLHLLKVYKDILISTIVDKHSTHFPQGVYKDILISTIVDPNMGPGMRLCL